MSYYTVKKQAGASFFERRSQFIGNISPAASNEKAVDFINKIRSEHPKAAHNVYAYIIRNNNISRYSDDGEPQGTAGIPVLEILKKNNLTDVCCVVTRYFGGVLLGAGGLVRAYSHTAKLAVNTAETAHIFECSRLAVNLDYSLYGKVAYILPDFEIKLLNSDFSDTVSLDILVKEDLLDPFKKKLADITNNNAVITESESLPQDFS